GVALALVAGLVQWLSFRHTHVVANHAFVRANVVQIGSPISGQVDSVQAEPGKKVKKGDVLLRFNDGRETAMRAQTKATLDMKQLKVGTEEQTIRLQKQRTALLRTRLKNNVLATASDRRAFQAQFEFADRAVKRAQDLDKAKLMPVADREFAE